MTDMRRTLLWVVFSMSLFLIWDAWNKHNGQPSLFSPMPAKVAAPAAALPAGGLPQPTLAGAAPVAAPTAPPGPAPVVAEQTVIVTDVV